MLGPVNRIRLLPEQVANQIAAGEVVERPASVVKELVENSLDAGTSRITVEIGAGGRSLIRVTDDGRGMSRDDALLCLERHATSKITRAEDLASIATMGFRGEALPSIASVSRFVITTREREDTSGEATQVVVNGGKIVEVKAAASPAGTTIEVRQIFFNLPARRKFLRAEETERAHIQHYLTLVALAWPQVGFSFVSDGRLAWQLPPVPWSSDADRFTALKERLRQLHGSETPLLPLEFSAGIEEAPDLEPGENWVLRDSGKLSRFRLWGFIGAPGVSRSSRDEQHLFVNQRPVENRGLHFALAEGYHTALMRGRYPVCCLFLEIDPAAVDVNVHPQKREVKFREESAVRRLVAKAIRDTLHAFHQAHPEAAGFTHEPRLPMLAGEAPGSPVPPQIPAEPEATLLPGFSDTVAAEANPPAALPAPRSHREITTPETNAAPALASTVPEAGSGAASPPVSMPAQRAAEPSILRPFEPLARPIPSTPLATVALSAVPASGQTQPTHSSQTVAPLPMATSGLPVALLQRHLRIIGVVGRLYVLLESERGLVLLDQHAAHERILFEQMIQRLEAGQQAASQRLLLPETVELSVRDAEFVRSNLETLTRMGIGLSEFGDRTFLLDALPPMVKSNHPKRFTLDLIDALKAAGSGVNLMRLGEDVIAKTVCRHAVKANDPLSGRELDQLLVDLKKCSMPYTCPHGRPTMIEMGWRDLEKRFGRTG
jgi:DNA mismatch repair protein MutL